MTDKWNPILILNNLRHYAFSHIPSLDNAKQKLPRNPLFYNTSIQVEKALIKEHLSKGYLKNAFKKLKHSVVLFYVLKSTQF